MRSILRSIPVVICIVGTWCFGATIQYTFTSAVTGTLNGTGFSNRTFTVAATSDAPPHAPSVLEEQLIDPVSQSFSIEGLGTGRFLGEVTLVFASHDPCCGIGVGFDASFVGGGYGDVVDILNNTLSTYHLGTPPSISNRSDKPNKSGRSWLGYLVRPALVYAYFKRLV
jgi:hypothetical protein